MMAVKLKTDVKDPKLETRNPKSEGNSDQEINFKGSKAESGSLFRVSSFLLRASVPRAAVSIR